MCSCFIFDIYIHCSYHAAWTPSECCWCVFKTRSPPNLLLLCCISYRSTLKSIDHGYWEYSRIFYWIQKHDSIDCAVMRNLLILVVHGLLMAIDLFQPQLWQDIISGTIGGTAMPRKARSHSKRWSDWANMGLPAALWQAHMIPYFSLKQQASGKH